MLGVSGQRKGKSMLVRCRGCGSGQGDGRRKRISLVWLRRKEMVEGWGKRGLEGNKERENLYVWDFIFSREEEGQLVVKGR